MAAKSLADQNRNISRRHHRLQGVAYSSSRALNNQRVFQRNKIQKNLVRSPSSRHNLTLFNEIFKLKKSRVIVVLPILIILLSAVPLSVAFKSYVWERQRAFIGEGNLLYDLFLIDEFMVLNEEQYPAALRGGILSRL